MPLVVNGVTIPQNVANALMVNGISVTQVIANGVAVWSQILGAAVGLFYGGFTGAYNNKVTRIDANGAMVGSETAVGTARQSFSGASL